MSRRAFSVLTLLLLSSPLSAQEAPVALQGATVHTGKETLAGATVVLQGGRIVSVGGDVPAGATVVDLSGQHLYPGLIDCSTALGLVEIGSVKGTTDDSEVGRLNPNLRPELAVNPDSELIGVARTGGVLFAHVHARSGTITGRTALLQLAGSTWEEMTIKAPVFLHVRWPSMTLDRSGASSTPTAKQVQARERQLLELEEAFREARAYAKARAAGSPDLDRDVKWEALVPAAQGKLPVAVQADDLTQIEAALDWAEREGLKLVIVGGADAWRARERLEAMQVPVILGSTMSLPRRRYEAVNTPYENAARLHEAGVNLAFSTGASAWAASNARNLRDSAAMAVAHGLPEDAALRALTLGAATLLGVQDRLGSIEPGKLATVFATQTPLFAHDSRVTRAWASGQAVDLVDRQRRLYERYKARPR